MSHAGVVKYDIVVGSKGDKHMVEYEHFNQDRVVLYMKMQCDHLGDHSFKHER